ncbi:NlpC/P60 family protein [Pararhodobacter sp.]|uniref:NlpC/P60 family protein n=1 Tax=Pararhodobacter sp. TaxID=2127056 RepID=UPI002AFECC3C|nr:NlpC/P60 family protein [Pararhodobacter sp.]
MSWSNRYVGLPFAEFGRDRAGCDCWGLACIIYREEMNIALPEYVGAYSSADEHSEIAALISGAATSPLWVPVAGTAMAFDIAVFRRGRFSTHLGIVIHHGIMIHMAGEDQSKVQGYTDGPYKHRFAGHFRHASKALERPVQLISEAAR